MGTIEHDREENDPLEKYLAETIDLRKEPAIVVEGDGPDRVYRTLDGTQVFLLNELAERTGLSAESLKSSLEAGELEGVLIGDWWLARLDQFSED